MMQRSDICYYHDHIFIYSEVRRLIQEVLRWGIPSTFGFYIVSKTNWPEIYGWTIQEKIPWDKRFTVSVYWEPTRFIETGQRIRTIIEWDWVFPSRDKWGCAISEEKLYIQNGRITQSLIPDKIWRIPDFFWVTMFYLLINYRNIQADALWDGQYYCWSNIADYQDHKTIMVPQCEKDIFKHVISRRTE